MSKEMPNEDPSKEAADVVAALGGTEEAAQHLDDWGWSGNAFRDFIADEDSPPATGTTFLNASVHRFADAESAANALTVFSDYVIVTQGLQNVESPAIGDAAILLVGAPDGVPLAVLYAQKGLQVRYGPAAHDHGPAVGGRKGICEYLADARVRHGLVPLDLVWRQRAVVVQHQEPVRGAFESHEKRLEVRAGGEYLHSVSSSILSPWPCIRETMMVRYSRR